MRIRAALNELSVRSAQALQLRLIAELSRSACARFYGISEQSFDVMLLRASRELRARLEGHAHSAESTSFAEELKRARALACSLEGDALVADAELDALLSQLQKLQSLSGEVRAQNVAAALEEQSSPHRRRRTLLWRLLFLAILGGALFLYAWPRPHSQRLERVPLDQMR